MTKDAVDSLYGGERSGRRAQRIYTSQPIVDALLRLWPEGIDMDPCSGPGSIVPARVRIQPPQNGCRYATKIPILGMDGEPITDAKGKFVYGPAPIGIPFWLERCYVNPEFGMLEPWLRQFSESRECVFLSPARTHRTWYMDAMAGATICALRPLCFHGYDQTFPAPLWLAYRGERRTEFAAATAEIGRIL